MKNRSKGGSIVGGFIILIIGICLLWYNEGRTVKTQAAINEASKNYTQVKSDKVDSKYDGKLIATNGKLDLSESNELVDEQFGIKAKSAILKRKVEMYQNIEECTTDDNDNERCTYKQDWSDDLIDSSSFKESGHTNPTTMPYESKEYLADGVKLGAYDFPKNLQSRLSTKQTVGEQKLIEGFDNRISGLKVNGNYINNIAEDGIPKVGNIRISFSYNDSESASVLAQQSGDSFVSYTAKNGRSVYRLKEGTHTGAEILQDMRDENNMWKWILRLIGTILVMGGIGGLFGPIQKLANFVPILGNLVSFATGLVSFVLGLAISLLVIAIAWFRYRPLLSIALIVIVVGLIVGLKFVKKDKVEEKVGEAH